MGSCIALLLLVMAFVGTTFSTEEGVHVVSGKLPSSQPGKPIRERNGLEKDPLDEHLFRQGKVRLGQVLDEAEHAPHQQVLDEVLNVETLLGASDGYNEGFFSDNNQQNHGDHRTSRLLEKARRHMRVLQIDPVPLRFRFITPPPPLSASGIPSATSDTRACSEVGQFIKIGTPPERLFDFLETPTPIAAPSTGLDTPVPDAQLYTPLCEPNPPGADEGSRVLTVTNCYHMCQEEDLVPTARRVALGLLLQRAAGQLEQEFMVRPRAHSIDLIEQGCGLMNISGYFVGNIVALVTVRPEYRPGGVAVDSFPCLVDPVTDRPEMIHVNIRPSVLDYPMDITERWVRRAFIHGIAMNLELAGKFIVPGSTQRYAQHGSGKYPTGPLKGDHVHLIDGRVFASPRKGQRVSMVTPSLLSAARKHFGCDSLSEVPLEDMGFADDLIFFEKRIFRGELMTVQSNFSISNATLEESFMLSEMTRGFMEDTGWYVLPRNVASRANTVGAEDTPQLAWGRNEGCDFVEKKCGFGGYDEKYLCTNMDHEPLCGFDRTFTGTCTLKSLDADIDPVYRVFSDTLRLGSEDLIGDRCPVVVPSLPSFGGRGFCGTTHQDASGLVLNLSTGWKQSESSRCFATNATLLSLQGDATTTPVPVGSSSSSDENGKEAAPARIAPFASCHEVICVVHPLTKEVVAHARIMDTFVPCVDDEVFHFIQPQSGETAELPNHIESIDITGHFQCGKHLAEVCQSPTVKNVPFWPRIDEVTPRTAWKNGGVIVKLRGQGLANCNAMRIGGVVSADASYNFPEEMLMVRMEFIPDHLGSTQLNGGLGLADVELRCVIPETCPQGCFVTRKLKAFNLTTLQPCSVTVERKACERQPVCAWIENLCVEKVFTDTPTAAPPQTRPPDNNVDVGCFLSVPRYCSRTQRCSQDPGRCLKCERPMVLCWNSECRENMNDCPCHPNTPFRCANSRSCVSSGVLCTETCDEAGPTPYQCWNRVCVASVKDCPCPTIAHPIRCENSGYCVGTQPECLLAVEEQCGLDACPEQFRVSVTVGGNSAGGANASSRDYACRPVPRNCPCSIDTPFRCWDGLCVSSARFCSCPKETPSQCTDGSCQATADLCSGPMTEPPCARDAYRCSDLSCVAVDTDCTCSEMTFTIPDLRIQLPDPQLVDGRRWLRIEAYTSFTPCHIDFGGMLTFQWSVTEKETQRPLSIRDALMSSAVLEIPPASLTANRTYLVEVTVKVLGGSRSQQNTASVTLFTVVPIPKVRILGGNRDIPAFSTLELLAEIHDPDMLHGALRWSCCLVNADGEICVPNVKCGGVFAAVVSLRGASLAIQAPSIGLPIGQFFFFVDYKGVSTRTKVNVQHSQIPTCSIVLIGKAYTNRPIIVQAVIDFSSSTSFQWSMNGTILAAKELRLTLPQSISVPAYSTTTVALTVTTTTDQLSECHLGIVPLPVVEQGRCVVVNDDPADVVDYRTSVGTAGYSFLELSAVAWRIPSADKLMFRVGYFDSTTKRRVFLSPDFSQVGSRRFIAPVMLHNPSLITVRFFVQVTTESDLLSVLGESTCLMDLRSHLRLSTSALFISSYQRMLVASRSNFLVKAVDLATQLGTLLEDPDVTLQVRKAAAVSFVEILDQLTTNATNVALSPTRRTTALSLLKETVGVLAVVNRSVTSRVQRILHVLTDTRDKVLFDYKTDLDAWKAILGWTVSSPDVAGYHTFEVLREFAAITASRVLPGEHLDFSRTIEKSGSQSPLGGGGGEEQLKESFFAAGYHDLPSLLVSRQLGPSTGSAAIKLPIQTAVRMLVSRKLADAAELGSTHSTPVTVASSLNTLQVAVLVATGAPSHIDTDSTIGGLWRLPTLGIPHMDTETLPPVESPNNGKRKLRRLLQQQNEANEVGEAEELRQQGRRVPNVVSHDDRDPAVIRKRSAQMTEETPPGGGSLHTFRAPRVTPLVWFGVRVAPAIGTSGLADSETLYEPVSYPETFWDAETPGLRIVLRLDASDEYAAGVPLWERNFSCMVLSGTTTRSSSATDSPDSVSESFKESSWVNAGPPTLTVSPNMEISGAAALRIDEGASCQVQHATGVVAIFDTSFMTELTHEPTPAPDDSKLSSRISQLTSRLSTNAIVAIVLAPVALFTGLALYAFFKRQKRLQMEEEERNEERTQVLLLTELVRHDKDLQGALDVSRVRAKYEDVL